MKNQLESEKRIEKALASERKRIKELLMTLPKQVRNEGSTQYTSEVVVPLAEWHAVLEKI